MIKDCESPYDGRHEGAARLGQDRHFTGSVSQYHGGCGPLSSSRGCPGVGLPSRSKANNPVISNGPARLWRRLIPLTRWPSLPPGRSAAARGDWVVCYVCGVCGVLEARRCSSPGRVVGPNQAAGRAHSGRSHDCVPNGWAFLDRRRQRVPFGALYDLNSTQRPLCPACLLSVVTMTMLCRCPASATRAMKSVGLGTGHSSPRTQCLSPSLPTDGHAIDSNGTCHLRHRHQTAPVTYATDTDRGGRWRR